MAEKIRPQEECILCGVNHATEECPDEDGPTPAQEEAAWGKVSTQPPPDTLSGMSGR